MTFSIAARCPDTGQVGVAVCSSSVCVAARCAHVRAGVGAALTQNVTDPRLGPALLDALEAGADAATAMAKVAGEARYGDWRQLLVVDREGRIAHHSGARVLGRHAVAEGRACIAGGNLLDNTGVPREMVVAFESVEGPLAHRLIAGLEAGLEAGGEEGPVMSAGVLVAYEQPWPFVDLRVDWDDMPIGLLRDLWIVYSPQAADYVTRAIAPDAAPNFGVPGDE